MSSVNLSPLLPEIFILVLACLVLLIDLLSKDKEKRYCYVVSQLGLAGLFIVLASNIEAHKAIEFFGHYIVDSLSIYLKLTIVLLSMIALLYARVFINSRQFLRGEYYVLTLFSILGMMVMVSAHSLLSLYIGVELLALCLYALVAMQRDDRRAPEAAIKYFVTGAIASGFLLYGMSLLYGITGHLRLEAIQEAIGAQGEMVWLARFAIIFFIAGLAFKLGLVPFHMWIPDVYHGAPTSVTAFLASVPKIAGYGFAIRLLLDGLSGFSHDWSQMLLIAGMLSIALGNVIAITQTNFKRLLAYSGIAHMGYFILGFYVEGYVASMYYVIVYAIMTLAAFGLLILMSRVGFECESLDDFKGLAKKNMWYAFSLALVMLSMAGIPPLIGFWPKLEIFKALIASGHTGIAVYAVIFSVIGLYYYLRVIKLAFFDEEQKEFLFVPSRSIRFAITFNCLALLILGLMPETIRQYCFAALTDYLYQIM